jgi:hypothetical protein
MSANQTEFKTSGSVNYALVPLHCFEEKRAVLKPAKMNKSGENEWCTSEGVYLDDDGKEHTLFFMLPTQRCYGLNANYDKSQKKAEVAGDVSKADSFQIAYPLTSLKTMKKPTKEEKYIRHVFESLHQKTIDRMKEEAASEKTEMPEISINSYEGAKRKKDMTKAVKPLFGHPNIKDTKTPNKEKPERTYIKVLSKGKGSKGQMTVQSSFYGPGDIKMSHLSLIGEKGNGDWEIVCKWDGAYWGAHGSANPHGGSTKLKIYDASVTPGSAGLPSERMAPRNTAPAVEQDYGEKADYDDPSGENEDFERETKKKKTKEPVKKSTKKAKVPPKNKKKVEAPKRKQRKQKEESDSESESDSGSESE